MSIDAGEVRARAHFQVLKDMGVLLSAEDDPCLAPAEGGAAPARHVFSAHAPLWQYEQQFYAHPMPGAPAVFETLDPASSLDQVLAKTRFICLVGAAPGPLVERLLAEPGVMLVLFDHDSRRLARFLAATAPARLLNRGFVFLGRPHDFYPPISVLLEQTKFAMGFPVFYVPEAASDDDEAYATEVIEYVETIFYRERVYPLGSQTLSRSIPFREISRELFYDQVYHAYENLPAFATCPDIGAIEGLFQGETAILAAAGAALAEQYDLLRENQDKAVIIAVNSALRPLVEAGIKPHFCIVNDNSLQVAKTFAGLPRLRPVMLVGHSLSALGGEVFPQKFLFSDMRPDIFGHRPGLRLHGSVITTAFALARHLGCARAVLAGALLSSSDPWSLSYVSGASGLGINPETRELTHRWPQLCPAKNRFGRQRYTSLNFLDVKHWLGEEIRLSGIPVINTSKDSIIDTPHVEFDEHPAIEPTGRLNQLLRQAHAMRRRTPLLDQALAFARREILRHQACLALIERVESLPPDEFPVHGAKVLEMFDQGNVSYLVQRFEDFSQPTFYDLITSANPEQYAQGLRYHFSHTARMLQALIELLQRQERRMLDMASPA
ncbi:MAG: DUF115 domain-containing protein [Desulfovibrio sp.]|nr:DUF115 domain-containing protein [Desulfovibrio sp.]